MDISMSVIERDEINAKVRAQMGNTARAVNFKKTYTINDGYKIYFTVEKDGAELGRYTIHNGLLFSVY